MDRSYSIQPGSRYPTGPLADADGINFSIFSRHATGVELLLYQHADSEDPFQVIQLDPDVNKTFFFWHVYVVGLPTGLHYTWRVDGPGDTEHTGFRFNANKELLDPWAQAVTTALWDKKRASDPHDTSRSSMRAITVANNYKWQGDRALNHPMEDSIIYELHVGGFTRHSSANVTHPGTFAGLMEKISYLKELGITDVELMPIMAFDEQDVPANVTAKGLSNYWGYSSHSFYSPHPGYCVNPNEGQHQREFRDMVKALHNANIGIILDVVFNHTSEGNHDGPIINFKGLVNEIFYHLDSSDRRKYQDFTGCGNTINCNHPLVTGFIVNCLAYWVQHMHVDGFRFDLASIFVRGDEGRPMYNAPLPWNIEFSQTLANTKLIAEAWDAAGLYQVGAFPGYRWAEWNGQYRDVVRRFIRGDKGLTNEVARCLSGSNDLYQAAGRLPINSINFITCHDGFTLHDLISYNHKHNENNGEDNRDGHNDNLSWNCGAEGQTNDSAILTLRRQQAKNFMALLFLSQGVPMILAGDEVLQTQHGNNNAYCQNNDVAWFDWRLVEENKTMFTFVKNMIAFRKRHPCLRRTRFFTGEVSMDNEIPDVSWHGKRLNEPHWNDPEAQYVVFTLCGASDNEAHLHIIFNMSNETFDAPLPKLRNRRWHRAIDTEQAPGEDVIEPAYQPMLNDHHYMVRARSVVVLEGRN